MYGGRDDRGTYTRRDSEGSKRYREDDRYDTFRSSDHPSQKGFERDNKTNSFDERRGQQDRERDTYGDNFRYSNSNQNRGGERYKDSSNRDTSRYGPRDSFNSRDDFRQRDFPASSYGSRGGYNDRDYRDADYSKGDRNRNDDRSRDKGPARQESNYGSRGFGGKSAKKPHMGEIDSVQRAVRSSPGVSDDAILSVIAPPVEELIRPDQKGDRFMPRLDAWRVSQELGAVLDNARHAVRANFFRVRTTDIPETIYHYSVAILRYTKDHELSTEDLTKNKEKGANTGIIKTLIEDCSQHENWRKHPETSKHVGIAYDGKSSMYSTRNILKGEGLKGGDGEVFEVVWPPGGKTSYSVVLSLVGVISTPRSTEGWRLNSDPVPMQALDIALLSFARWQIDDHSPSWLLSGNKAFRVDGTSFDFGSGYLGKLGYAASLRTCMSGLALVCDSTLSCFLQGGNLTKVMALVGGFRSVEELAKQPKDAFRKGSKFINLLTSVLKNSRVKTVHLGHLKTIKGFGAASDDRETEFTDDDGSKFTVSAYFEKKAQSSQVYAKALSGGKLRFPTLPTIQVGSKKKSILVPPEMLEVLPGQTRNRLPPEIAAHVIKQSALAPGDRMRNILGGSHSQAAESLSSATSLFSALSIDPDSRGFGLSGITAVPMKVQGVVLPPPKLLYAQGRIVEPELRGTWNLAGGIGFAHPAPLPPSQKSHSLGSIVVYAAGRKPGGLDTQIQRFMDDMESEGRKVGMKLSQLSGSTLFVENEYGRLSDAMRDLKSRGASIVVVFLHYDAYALVKLTADSISLPTQCVKWSNFNRPPRNYQTALLIKMNLKLGGVNHTLASRGKKVESKEEVFQDPPQSISWLFDEPCMVVGVDVNHPESNDKKDGSINGENSSSPFSGPSVAAVVASMDGRLGQYCAHISTCNSRIEPVSNLQLAMSALLDTFAKRNNGNIPRRIIIYRDGISDNQFAQVLEKEIHAYKDALHLRGYDESSVQIAVVMCQKRHNARIVYEDGGKEGLGYLNPCVGLCIDGRHFLQANEKGADNSNDDEEIGSISTPGINEFYLNSHAAVLGTSKPTKYVLIYDEIGLKLTELELLTFWTTHLYGRCTRSVSYATPAYYAHWAARRGKALLSAGATEAELSNITNNWLKDGAPNGMFFA